MPCSSSWTSGRGALGVGDLGDLAGEHERVRRGERAPVRGVGPAGQAGVAVAEQHEAGHAEHPGDLLELGAAPLPDGLAAAQRHPGAAQVAVRGDDEHGARAGVGEAAQRQPGEDRLVVGVGVQDQDGVAAQVTGVGRIRGGPERGRAVRGRSWGDRRLVRAADAAVTDGTGGVSCDNDSDSTPDSSRRRAAGWSGRSRAVVCHTRPPGRAGVDPNERGYPVTVAATAVAAPATPPCARREPPGSAAARRAAGARPRAGR